MSLAIEPVYEIDPAQVGDLNVFADQNTALNHLTNDIHPVWAYRNWSRNVRVKETPRMECKKYRDRTLSEVDRRARCRELPANIYERMQPALRLASLFLEKSLPWFFNVRYAPYQSFGRPKQKELRLDPGDWSQSKEDRIRRDLNIIAERYFILHGLYGWELNATGASLSVRANLDADVPEDPDEDEYTIYWGKKEHLLTVIAKETIEFMGSQRWLDLPLAMQQRCLFQLALLMVHELAHIVNFYRSEEALLNNEPYYRRTEPTRELGFSWEYYMFDGLVGVVDGEFSGPRPGDDTQGVTCLPDWPYEFQSHVQDFSEWKHPKSRMDDFKHSPGRWLVASKSIEQFFDMCRWNQWLRMPIKHGSMDQSPFVVHLSPSLFMILSQERSLSYDVWFYRRLHKATGLVWPEVINYDSHHSDTDWSPPSSPDSPEDPPASPNAMDTS